MKIRRFRHPRPPVTASLAELGVILRDLSARQRCFQADVRRLGSALSRLREQTDRTARMRATLARDVRRLRDASPLRPGATAPGRHIPLTADAPD